MLSLNPANFGIALDDPMRNEHDPGLNHHYSNVATHNFSTVDDDQSAETSGEEDSSAAEPSTKARSTSRLPPRSRTGCWTCRRRKVKCDEKHPVCGQCLRLQQVCDYEPHYEFRYDTYKQRAKRTQTGIDEAQSPAWDRRARRQYDPRTSHLDDMPSFRSLNSEEDRERKAAFHIPGTYHVVADQKSFSSLPEYGGSSSEPSSAAAVQSASAPPPTRPSAQRQSSLPDPNLIVLERFETPNDRQPLPGRQHRQHEEQQDDRHPRSHSQPVPMVQPSMSRTPTSFQPHQPGPRQYYNLPSQASYPTQQPAPGYGAHYFSTAPQLVPPVYSPGTQGYPQLPFRRSYTHNATASEEPYPAPPPLSRHLSMSLTSGSGSVLEEISGMRSAGYTLPKSEESIEDWDEELYSRQG